MDLVQTEGEQPSGFLRTVLVLSLKVLCPQNPSVPGGMSPSPSSQFIASNLTSLNLNFLICEMKIMITSYGI